MVRWVHFWIRGQNVAILHQLNLLASDAGRARCIDVDSHRYDDALAESEQTSRQAAAQRRGIRSYVLCRKHTGEYGGESTTCVGRDTKEAT